RNSISRAWQRDFFSKTPTPICRLCAPHLQRSLENGNRLQVLECYFRAMSARKKYSSARGAQVRGAFEKPYLFSKGRPAAFEENPAPPVRDRACRYRTGAIDRVPG